MEHFHRYLLQHMTFRWHRLRVCHQSFVGWLGSVGCRCHLILQSHNPNLMDHHRFSIFHHQYLVTHSCRWLFWCRSLRGWCLRLVCSLVIVRNHRFLGRRGRSLLRLLLRLRRILLLPSLCLRVRGCRFHRSIVRCRWCRRNHILN